jgi:hypothetical protein
LGLWIAEYVDYQWIPQPTIYNPAVSHLENGDTMGERIGRIGQIETDFLGCVGLKSVNNPTKSVSICPIRPIRSPIVSQTTFRCVYLELL